VKPAPHISDDYISDDYISDDYISDDYISDDRGPRHPVKPAPPGRLQ
jgi:hypothetical protein